MYKFKVTSIEAGSMNTNLGVVATSNITLTAIDNPEFTELKGGSLHLHLVGNSTVQVGEVYSFELTLVE